jgi:hypothetical protein
MFQWGVFLQVLGNRGVTDRCPVCEQETDSLLLSGMRRAGSSSR